MAARPHWRRMCPVFVRGSGNAAFLLLDGDLIQKTVLFTYLTCTDQPVLRGLSTTGRMRHSLEHRGVAGRQLLRQFYGPTSGRITLGGTKFGSADVHHLQEHQSAIEPIRRGFRVNNRIRGDNVTCRCRVCIPRSQHARVCTGPTVRVRYSRGKWVTLV